MESSDDLGRTRTVTRTLSYLAILLYGIVSFSSTVFSQEASSTQFLIAYDAQSSEIASQLASPDSSYAALPYLVTGPYQPVDFPQKTTPGSLVDLLLFEKGYKTLVNQNPNSSVAVVSAGRGALTALRAIGSRTHPELTAAIIDTPSSIPAETVIKSIPTSLPLLLVHIPSEGVARLADMLRLARRLLLQGHPNIYFVGLAPVTSSYKTYTQLAHAFYERYGIAHSPELANEGRELLDAALLTPQLLAVLEEQASKFAGFEILEELPDLHVGAFLSALAGSCVAPALASNIVDAWVGFESAVAAKTLSKEWARSIKYYTDIAQQYLPSFFDIHAFVKDILKVAFSIFLKFLSAQASAKITGHKLSSWYEAGVKTLILQESINGLLRAAQSLQWSHDEELFDLGIIAAAAGFIGGDISGRIGRMASQCLPTAIATDFTKKVVSTYTAAQIGDLWKQAFYKALELFVTKPQAFIKELYDATLRGPRFPEAQSAWEKATAADNAALKTAA
jgi:hypothetical protein